jgi:carbonic anhydrase
MSWLQAPVALDVVSELRAVVAARRLVRGRSLNGDLANLLENNRRWAADRVVNDPRFFSRLSEQQAPAYLWIGCSDSRVPANEIVGLLPGELFVHRNVANVVVHSDLNCLSVLQYAVDVLRVRDVIVCGHYGCGGVRAAYERAKFGLIDNWLRHVQDVRQKHAALLDRQDPAQALDCLCELNVLEQAASVCATTIVQDAWERGQPLTVHAVIYRLTDGLLRDLRLRASRPEDVMANYHAAVGDAARTAWHAGQSA